MPQIPKDKKLLAPRLVAYEIEWLFECARYMNEHPKNDGRGITWNCVMNSLHVHARNLLDFFATRAEERDNSNDKRKDDVVCKDADYVDAPLDRPQCAQWERSLRERCNKRLAHISYSRLDGSFDILDLQVFQPLVDECIEFLRCEAVRSFTDNAAQYEGDPVNAIHRRRGKEWMDNLRDRVKAVARTMWSTP